jgi:hypothetical protein
MIVFPLIAAGVSAVFAFLLLRQWSSKRRVQQLAWGIAMAMFAVASIAVALGVSGGWTSPVYKIYWLFGALLNVPWLALGSIALLNKRVLTLSALGLVLLGSLFAFWKVATGDVTRELCPVSRPVGSTIQCKKILDVKDIPRGSEAWFEEPSVCALASMYSIPAFFVVVGIAVYTSQPRRGVRPPRDRIRANMFIAAGTTIVAIGGSALARLAQGFAFSFTLAIGVVVMFVGFLMASRAPRHHVEDPGQSPT